MRIVKILSKLSPKTLNSALLFFNSPYFNTRKSVSVAFEMIIDSITREIVLSKEELWGKVYKEKPYNDILFRKLINVLTQKLELFFSVENLQSKEHLKLRTLADFSQTHNLSELKNKLQKSLDSSTSAKKVSFSEALFDLYTAKRSIVDIEGDFKRKKDFNEGREYVLMIKDLNAVIESSYLVEKLKLFLLQYWIDFDTDLLSEVNNTNHISELISAENSYYSRGITNLYISTFNYLTGNSHGKTVEDIIKQLDLLIVQNKSETKIVFNHVYNYTQTQIASGDNLSKEQFYLLNFGINSNLLVDNGVIDPIWYREIVFTACRVSEFNWALKFVEEYKVLLSTEHRQSAYSFSKARIFNNMGNHEGVIDVLRNVEYEDITYNLNSRLMLIMAFYELDEYDTLDSTIKSFKVFLRRKRNVSVKRKTNFRDFCDVVYNLVRAADRKDADRLSKAKDILSANPGIPSSWWLKEKIETISDKLGIPKEDQPAT